jgi:hypothetical protein
MVAVAAGAFLLSGGHDAADGALPGVNGLIAYQSLQGADYDVMVMRPTPGAAATNLTAGPDGNQLDQQPSWTADGKRILFSSGRQATSGFGPDIYAMGADGSNPTSLTSSPAFDGDPSTSSSGSQIVFASTDDIFVMNADGSGQQVVGPDPRVDSNPSLSPDGSRIIFQTRRGLADSWDIYAMTPSGGALTNLTPTNDFDDVDADWSPDGTRIAFVSNEDGDLEIFTMNADGTGRTQHTFNTVTDVRPAWSPDGAKIAYQSDSADPTNVDIYVLDVNAPPGTPPIRLTTDPAVDGAPSWQPLPSTPGPSPPPVDSPPAAEVVSGRSSTIVRGIWLSAADSFAASGRAIALYQWDLNGDGHYEAQCGPDAPAVSTPAVKAGVLDVGMRVVDTVGQASVATERVTMPASALALSGKVAAAKVAKLSTVFACLDPGPGNQPDRSDCVKTFSFGIVTVNSRGGRLNCFAITARKSPANSVSTAVRASQAATDRGTSAQGDERKVSYVWDYHATIRGPVALNGLYLPLPRTQPTEYDSGESSISLGQVTVEVGSFKLGPYPVPKTVVTPDRKGRFHLGDIPLLPSSAKVLGGLQIFAATKVSVDLVHHASLTTIALEMPSPFTYGGREAAKGDVVLRSDNQKGVTLDGVKVGPIPNLFLGPLLVKNLAFSYRQTDETLQGGATIGVPGGAAELDASTPPFGLGLRRGRFDYAGAGVNFPIPALRPVLFPGVTLTHIGVAVGIDPVRLTGRGGIAVAELVEIDGALMAVFASPQEPWAVENPAPELAALAGKTLDNVSLAVGGVANLKVPVLGKLPLEKGHILYIFPDYAELAGGIEIKHEYFSLQGGVSGFVAVERKLFNLEGKITVCLTEPIKICAPEVGAVVSTKGIAVCTIVPVPTPIVGTIPVPAGIGYKWGDSVPDVMVFSCSIGPYRDAAPVRGQAFVENARTTSRADDHVITLQAGLPSAQIRTSGAGAPPEVTLTGPTGQTITTPAGSPESFTQDVAIWRQENDTMIALRKPAPGEWRISVQAGSSPITRVAYAGGLPEPSIRAHVTGSARARSLTYDIGETASQKVTFVERGARTYRVIGEAEGRRGTLAFAPAAGRGERREIVALVERDGVQTHTLTVARYAAPATARAEPPAGLSVTRRGERLRISWQRAAGASRYGVLVTDGNGRRIFRVTTRTRLVVAGVRPDLAASVAVTALGADGQQGIAARTRVSARDRAASEPATRERPARRSAKG